MGILLSEYYSFSYFSQKKAQQKQPTHPNPNAPIHTNNAGKAIKAFSEAPAILSHIHFLSYSKHKNPNTLQAVTCRH